METQNYTERPGDISLPSLSDRLMAGFNRLKKVYTSRPIRSEKDLRTVKALFKSDLESALSETSRSLISNPKSKPEELFYQNLETRLQRSNLYRRIDSLGLNEIIEAELRNKNSSLWDPLVEFYPVLYRMKGTSNLTPEERVTISAAALINGSRSKTFKVEYPLDKDTLASFAAGDKRIFLLDDLDEKPRVYKHLSESFKYPLRTATGVLAFFAGYSSLPQIAIDLKYKVFSMTYILNSGNTAFAQVFLGLAILSYGAATVIGLSDARKSYKSDSERYRMHAHKS